MELRQRRRFDDADDVTPQRHLLLNDKPRIVTFFQLLVLLLGFISIIFGISVHQSPLKTVKIPKPLPLENRLKPNFRLTEGKSLKFKGASSVAQDNEGNMYSGLADGRIIKIATGRDHEVAGGRVDTIFTSRFPGASMTTDAKHGCPISVRIKNKQLFILDAVYGLYSIDVITRQMKFYVKPDDVIPPLRAPTDFVVSSNGKNIYFSDSNLKFPFHSPLYSIIGGSCTGRVFHYDVTTRNVHIFRDKLCHVGGLELNAKEKTLVVVETSAQRVLYVDTKTRVIKYQLALKTIPFHVRLNRRGNYWIASQVHKPSWLLSNQLVCKSLASILPYSMFENLFYVRHSVVVEVTPVGKILQSLHDPDKMLIDRSSHASDLSDGRIALGSFTGDYFALCDYKDPPAWMLDI